MCHHRNANEELKDGTSTDDEDKLTASTDTKAELDKNMAIKKEGMYEGMLVVFLCSSDANFHNQCFRINPTFNHYG